MKFGKTYTNKLISFVDRYFTYDYKEMRRENTGKIFDFYAREYDTDTSVVVDKWALGIYVSIRRDGKEIIGKTLCTYKEVADFKRMIRCLG